MFLYILYCVYSKPKPLLPLQLFKLSKTKTRFSKQNDNIFQAVSTQNIFSGYIIINITDHKRGNHILHGEKSNKL